MLPCIKIYYYILYTYTIILVDIHIIVDLNLTVFFIIYEERNFVFPLFIERLTYQTITVLMK